MERWSLLLLLLVVAANAGPLNVRKKGICARTCSPTTELSKFKLQPGREYTYDYVSNTVTSLTGETKQSSGLQIRAKAVFEVLTPCEMALKMRDVKVLELTPEDGKTFVESPRTLDFKHAVEQQDLHFSFNDGAISDVCPSNDEKTWVLNVKRGVISMIQNTMASLDEKHEGRETDVAGECKVRYWRQDDTIRREKDLIACSGREHRQSNLQSIPYFVRSDMQAAPLTLSRHVCHQTVGANGLLSMVTCEEQHRLRSLGREKEGARTTVSQTLTFAGDAPASRRSHTHAHRRTTLKFEFELKSAPSGHELREVRDFLREVCARSRKDIRPQTPRFFTELVYRLRRLDEKDLRTIYVLVDRRKACRTNNEIVRRLVVDAIPILGNAQSMAIMKSMILSGRVSNVEANLWLTSLAFVQRPSHQMLLHLHPLLSEKEPRRQAVLGVSAMVHQYCRGRSECHAEPAVQAIGRSLRRVINGDCSTAAPEERVKVLLALKAIGNAGVLSAVSPDLVRCIKRAENPMHIRVAATEAFRRMDCSVDRKGLVEVYKNIEIDSELRIHAYLALMACPSEETVEVVRKQLSVEKVNQVGSFVWTHLTNLAETSDPLRAHIRRVVEDVSLKREFKLDKLKFSRNIEKSIFFDSMNAGGRMESNVIWSHKSFLPRSVSLNLTTHLFGQSYNFFELSGRVEGLETVLERYFGPDGYFKPKGEKGAKKSGLSNNDFQFMDNKFKLQNDRLRAALGFKVFGHDVAYLDLIDPDRQPGPGFNFLELLIRLSKEQEVEWSKHFMFLDSTITIPTVSGLPLELSINGTSSVSLKARGKLDIRRLVSWPTTFDISGSVQPSGSVEVSAMMGVNAYYSRHGLKMVSNAHTSTRLDAKLRAKDSETFDVEFGMPRDKQEIVNFDTKFFVVHRNVEREHTLESVRRFDRRFCTGAAVSRALGAELCASVRSPAVTGLRDALALPVVGPLTASVALYKRDSHSAYRLALRWQRVKHRLNQRIVFSRFVRFEVDTPGSRIPRRHLLDFALNFDTRALKFHVESPQGRLGLSGAFTNKPDHKELKLKFFKGGVFFHVNAASRVVRRGQTVSLRPVVKVMVPGLPHISLSAMLTRQPNRYDASAELRNLLRGPLAVRASAELGRSRSGETTLEAQAGMSSHFFVGATKVRAARGYRAVSASVSTKYGPSLARQHSAEASARLREVMREGARVLSLSGNARASQWAWARAAGSGTARVSRGALNLHGKLNFGRGLARDVAGELALRGRREPSGALALSGSGFVKSAHLGRHHSAKARIRARPDGLALDLDYRHRPAEKTLKLRWQTRVERRRRIVSDLAATLGARRLVWAAEVERAGRDLVANFQADLDGRRLRAAANVSAVGPRHFIGAATARVDGLAPLALDADLRLTARDPHLRLTAETGGRRFAGAANYALSGPPGEPTLAAGADLQWPERRVRATAELARAPGAASARVSAEWDVGRDASRRLSASLAARRGLDAGKRSWTLDARWAHPRRTGHLELALEREDYKASVHAELALAPKRLFVVDAMAEVDDGWTQKGLMASVTVRTPFPRFQRTHLGVNLLGQLRYRKAEVQLLWGNNKRIVTTLVVRPTGGTNFLATLKVVTPYARYSYMRFHLKNELTGNQVQSELIGEVGTRKTYLKVMGVNNGDYYSNDLAMTVALTTPFADFRDLTLTVDHKDDSNQYASNLEFKWSKDRRITAAASFNFNRNGPEVTTDGRVEFTTPFDAARRGALAWNHQNTLSMIKSDASLEYRPDRRLAVSLSGLVTEPEAGALRVTSRAALSATELGEVTAELTHQHSSDSLKLRLQAGLPRARNYELAVGGSREARRLEGGVHLTSPHDGFRKIGAFADLANEETLKTLKAEIYCGNTKAALASLNGKLTLPASPDGTVFLSGAFRNQIVRQLEVSGMHQHTLGAGKFSSLSELTYAPGRALSLTNEVITGNTGLSVKSQVKTPFRALRSLIAGFSHAGGAGRFQHSHFIIYNDEFDLNGALRFAGPDDMLAEWKLNFRGFHQLRLAHRRRGRVYDTGALLTYATSRTVELKSQVETGLGLRSAAAPALKVDVRLTAPFRHLTGAQLRLVAERPRPDALSVTGGASYTAAERALTLAGVLAVAGPEDVRATLEMKTPFDKVRDVSVLLRHKRSGKELVTSLTGKSEEGRVELTNILQRVGTFKNKLTIKSPLRQFRAITVSFEHRGQFPRMAHKHHLSFDVAGVRASLDNKFDVFNLRLIEAETKFRSNVRAARKAGLRFTFDKPVGGIETGVLVEWPTDKLEGRVAFKSSPEKKVQLKISTPFYYFKELQGLYTLGRRGPRRFKHHIILAFRNEPVTLAFENALTVNTLNFVDAQLKINTPLDALKSLALSYRHELLRRSKKARASGEYNGRRYALDAGYSDLPVHALDLTLETPHTNWRRVQMRHELMLTDRANWKLSSEMFNADLQERLVSTAELRAEPGKVDARHGFSRNAKIQHEVRLRADWQQRQQYSASLVVMNKMFPKSASTGQMVFAEASADLRKAVTLRATLRTPFPRAENQWFSLRFERNEFLKADTMKTGNLEVKGFLLEREATMQLRYSYGKRPSFQLNLKLPERREMKLEGSLVMSPSNSYLKMSLAAPDLLARPWTLMVDVTTSKTISVNFKLDTSLRKLQTVAGRASITRRARYAKVTGRLSLPTLRKPIEFELEGDLNAGVSLAANLRGPVVRYFRSSLKFVGDRRRFDFGAEVFSNYLAKPMTARVKFAATNGFKLEADLRSPFDKLRRAQAEAAVDVAERRGYLELDHELLSKPIRADAKVDFSRRKLDASFSLKTAFKGAEFSELKLFYERVGFRVMAKTSLSNAALSGGIRASLLFDFVRPKVELSAKVETPFEPLKDCSLSLVLLAQRDLNGRFSLTHNKIPGTVSGRVDLRWPRSVEMELSTPYEGWYKHLVLSAELKRDGARHRANGALRYYPANVINAKFEAELNLPKIYVTYNIATPFRAMRQTYGSVNIKAERNFRLEGEAYHNSMKEKITLSVSADDADTKTLTAQWNSPFEGALKDIGVKLYFTPKPGAFNVLKAFALPKRFSAGAIVNYHLSQEIALSASLDWASLRKFDAQLKLSTPLEAVRKTSLRTQIDVQNNILLFSELTHNKLSESLSTRLFVDKRSRKFFFRLSSPFEGPQRRVVVEGALKPVGDKQRLEASAEYYQGKKFFLTAEVRPDLRDFTLDYKLTTPFEVMRETAGMITFSPKAKPMLRFDLTHNKLAGKIEGRLHVRPFRRLKFILKTPFDGPAKSIFVDYSVRKTGRREVASLEVRYAPARSLQGTLAFERGDKELKTSLTFRSPFEVMRKLEASLVANWGDKVTGVLELSHNKLAESIHAELHYTKKELLQLAVTTPFAEFKSFDLKVTYGLRAGTHRAGVTATYNKAHTVELHGFLKLSRAAKEFFVAMKSPLPGIWRSVSLGMHYTTPPGAHAITMKMTYDAVRTIEINASTTTDPSDLALAYSVSTPFEAMRRSEGKLELKLLEARRLYAPAGRKFAGRLEFVHNKLMEGKRLVVKADGAASDADKSLDAAVTYLDKTYTGKLYLRRAGARFTAGASAVTDKPDRPWFVHAEAVANSARDFSLAARMTSPEHRLDSGKPGLFQLRLAHKGGPTNFKHSFVFTSPYKKDARYEGFFSSADRRAKFELVASVAQLRRVLVEHAGDLSTFKTQALVGLSRARALELSASGRVSRTQVSGQVQLKTPFDAWRESSLTLEHSLSTLRSAPRRATSRLALASSRLGGLKLNHDMTVSADALASDFTLDSTLTRGPLPKRVRTILKVSPMRAAETSAALSVESSVLREKVELALRWRKQADSLSAKVDVNAIKDFLKSSVELEGSRNSASLKLTSRALRQPVEARATWKKSDASLEATAETKMPVKFLTSKLALRVPIRAADTAEAFATFSSTDLRQPVEARVAWKKGYSAFEASAESKMPVKFLTSKLTLRVPKMTAAEAEATLSLTSTDLREPATATVAWKKGYESFEASLESRLPVKVLRAKAAVSIPRMRADAADATVTVTSAALRERLRLRLWWKKSGKSLEAGAESNVPLKALRANAALKMARVGTEETDATVTVTSAALREPVEASLAWKKTGAAFSARLETKLPVKFLNSRLEVAVPRMRADDAEATATLTSSDLREPVAATVAWKKTGAAFSARLETKLPVKFLRSKLMLDVPRMRADDAEATVRLSSTDLREPVAATVAWTKTATAFQARVETQAPFKYLKSKLEVRLPRMGRRESQASLKLTSAALTEPVKAYLNWKKSYSAFVTSMGVQAPVKFLKSQLVLKVDPMSASEFNAELSLESTDLKEKIVATAAWKNNIPVYKVFSSYNTMAASFSLRTPFEPVRRVAAKIAYGGNRNNINAELELTANKLGTFTSTLKAVRRQSLKLDVFVGRSASDKLFALNVNAQTSKMTAVLELPNCRHVKKVTLVGTSSDSDVNYELTWDANKVAVALKRQGKSKYSATIETTFKGYERMAGEVFASERCCDDVKYSLLVSHPRGRLSARVAWKKSNGLTASGALENSLIPRLPNASFKLTHRGTSARKFDSELELQVAGRAGRAVAAFDVTADKEGRLEVQTPFRRFKSTKASFKFSGRRSKFSLTADAQSSFGSGSLEVVSATEGRPTDRTTATATVKVNRSAYRLALNFEGEPRRFKAGLRLDETAGRVRRAAPEPWLDLQLASALSDSSYTASASLTSKLLPASFRTTSASVACKGDLRRLRKLALEVAAEVRRQRYSAELRWDASSGRTARASVRVPVRPDCVHSGEALVSLDAGFRAAASALRCGKKVAELDLSSNLRNKAAARLRTPLQRLNSEAKYEHNVVGKSATATLTARNARLGEAKASFSAAWATEVTAELLLELPRARTVALKLRQRGGLRKMAASATLTLPNTKEISTSAAYSLEGPLSASLKLRTPYRPMRSLDVALRHDQQPRKSQTTAELKHSQLGAYKAALSFDGSRSAFLVFSLTTPHRMLREAKVSFSYQGRLDAKVEQTLFLTWNGKTLGYTAAIDVPRLLYRVVINTPFPGLEKIVISNEHEGDRVKFRHAVTVDYGAGRALSLELRHHRRGADYTGSLRFRSPLRASPLRDLHLQVSHRRVGPTRWQMDHRLSFAPGRVLRLRGELDHGLPELRASLNLETPFAAARRVEVKLAHNHRDALDFDFDHQLNVDERKGGLQGRLKRDGPKTVGFLMLNTPFRAAKHFDATLRHVGGWRKFENEVSATYAIGRSVSAKTRFDISGADALEASVHVDTPWARARTARVLLSHKGGLLSHLQRAEMGLNDKSIVYNGIVSVLDPMDMETDHSLTTPFQALRNVKLSFDHKAGIAHLSLRWNDSNFVKMVGLLKRADVFLGQLTVTSSFHNLRLGRVRVQRQGPPGKTNAAAALNLNGAESELRLRFRRSLPEVTLSARAPHSAWYKFHVSVEQEKQWYKGRVQVSKGNADLASLRGSLKFDVAAPRKMLDLKLDGVLPVRGPKDFKLQFSFSGDKQRFVAMTKGEFVRRHVVAATLTYNTYRQVLAKLDYNGRPFSLGYIFGPAADMPNGKNLAVTLTVDKRTGSLSVDVSPEQLKVDVRTPFARAREIYFFLSHKQVSAIDFIHRSLFRLNKHRYFNLDLTVDTKNGRIAMRAPTVFTVKYSLVGTKFVRAVLEVDPDKTDASKKLVFQLFGELERDLAKGRLRTEGFFSLKSQYRYLVLETKTSLAPTSFFHKSSVRPKGRDSKPWSIYISTLRHLGGHGRERTDEWILSTPVRELKVHMETMMTREKLSNEMNFYWDNARIQTKKMGWRLTLRRGGPRYRMAVLFHHPQLRGVQLDSDTELNVGSSLIRSRTTLRYSENPREAIDLNVKLSRGGPRMLRGVVSLRQEATRLDTRLEGSFGGNRGIYINGVELRHRSADNKMRTFKLSTHVNVLKRSVMVEVMTPVRTYSWMSVVSLSRDAATVTYQLSYDKNKKASGELVLSRAPRFKLRLFFNPGNADSYVEALGRFERRRVELQVHRMVANRRYSDFLFSLRLRDQHLLKTRIFWRPTLLAEARDYLRARAAALRTSARTLWPKFVGAARAEWTLKRGMILATVPNLDALRRYSDKEVVAAREDLYRLGGMLYDSYMSNEFYLYDASRALVRWVSAARRRARVAAVAMRRSVVEDLLPRLAARLEADPIFRRARNGLRRLAIRLSLASRRLSVQVGAVGGLGRRCVSRAVDRLTPVVRSLHLHLARLEARAGAAYRSVATAVRRHLRARLAPGLARAQAWAQSALRTAAALHRDSRDSLLRHAHRDLRQRLGLAHARAQAALDALATRSGALFRGARARLERALNGSLPELPGARLAADLVRAGVRRAQWAYDSLELERRLKELGHAHYMRALEFVREHSIDVIRDLLRLEQSRVTAFEPSRGRIEAQLYLPFRLDDFRSRPDFSDFGRASAKMTRAYRRLFARRPAPLPAWAEVRERVLRFLPSVERNPRAWLPAFRGYASLAGRHVITFDKAHFDLDVAGCDVVLARDYKAARWAVVLNQARGKRFVSFHAYGRVFAIHRDHSVTVDGKKVELPFVHRNLTILRFGPIIKAKDALLGFSVTADVANDLHTLGVAGWYHGRLAGLFGNFDNEQFNDMQTPDHRLATSADFQRAWAVRQCTQAPAPEPQPAQPRRSAAAERVCRFLFANPLSPLSKCFRHVDAKPFLRLCAEEEPRGAACNAARLYAYHCRKAYVRVRLPRPCRRCAVPGRAPLREDAGPLTLENRRATADVVFVVEEAPCNRDLVPRLADLVRRMELAFARRGMTGNRYGLLAFGRRVHGLRRCTTHAHTVGGRLLGDARNFRRALDNFELDEGAETPARGPDALHAIRKAARYPLRPGSARHVVVVPCDACQERRLAADELEEALKEQDLSLFVLREHQLRLRRPNMQPQSNYLFGVDRSAVFTQRDVRKLRGDTRLHRRVVRPRDACSRVAYATRGAVFNSRKLTKMHVTSQAWFAQVFANRVATVSSSPRQVECSCSLDRWDNAHLACAKKGVATVQVSPRAEPRVLPLALPAGPDEVRKLHFRR